MTDLAQGLDAIPTSGSSAIQRSTGATLDHDQFLTLLVAQLENQDPLEPMNNQEFAAQMAQFGQLESLNSIDGRIEEQLAAQMLSTQAVNNTMAATLIGKEVLAVGNTTQLDGGRATLNVSLTEPADTMTINVFDVEGNVVRTFRQKIVPGGAHTIAWDGMDNNGEPVKGGTYGFDVDARDANGNVIEALTASTGVISGVSYEGGSAMLLVGDQRIAMGDVISINTPGG